MLNLRAWATVSLESFLSLEVLTHTNFLHQSSRPNTPTPPLLALGGILRFDIILAVVDDVTSFGVSLQDVVQVVLFL